MLLLNPTSDKAKMLVYLYGRGFMERKSKKERKATIKLMTQPGENAERLLRVLQVDGDHDRSGEEAFAELYARTKVSLDRYFQQQPGAFGFLPDMRLAEYFFRCQKTGNCCYQAPSIALAYLAQKHGLKDFWPIDVSKFIRSSSTDEELIDYVLSKGGSFSHNSGQTSSRDWRRPGSN